MNLQYPAARSCDPQQSYPNPLTHRSPCPSWWGSWRYCSRIDQTNTTSSAEQTYHAILIWSLLALFRMLPRWVSTLSQYFVPCSSRYILRCRENSCQFSEVMGWRMYQECKLSTQWNGDSTLCVFDKLRCKVKETILLINRLFDLWNRVRCSHNYVTMNDAQISWALSEFGWALPW